MPDFFVPDVDFKPFASGKREKSRAAIKAADVTTVLDSIKKILSPELVQKLGAVYEFTIKGKHAPTSDSWWLWKTTRLRAWNQTCRSESFSVPTA